MMVAGDTAHIITGPPRSGKTTRLHELAAQARASGAAVSIVRAPDALSAYAFDILRRCGVEATPIDDIDAADLLAHSAADLLELQWPELLDASIDPEVGGLRSPQRFLAGAYRLFRKLREAAIEPDEFLSRALTGATNFYAKPPNFAHPELIGATKETYRDSLDVTPQELQRQRLREIDLAKILASLYSRYTKETLSQQRFTCRDAVAAAHALLTANATALERERAAAPHFFIDEAQELSGAELALLRLLFGDSLAGVTLAGDPQSALSAHAGSQGHRIFSAPNAGEVLTTQYGIADAARNAAAQLQRAVTLPAPGAAPALTLQRFADEAAELAGVAQRVRDWVDQGIDPAHIAILFRSVCDAWAYQRAVLDLDIPATINGDLNIFNDPFALDALALLWNVWDPFAHAWLLRTLQGPSLALSDATLATLCGEPADPQAALFALDDERAPTVRASRWDPKRDLRLGWNVIRGDVDNDLSSLARERVQGFRTQRMRWVALAQELPLREAISQIWNEGLARDGAPGSARAAAQQLLLKRLLARLLDGTSRLAAPALGDALQYAQARRESEFESCEDDIQTGVQICSIAAARGRSFECVAIADLRAGSFPRWYAPDAFLFSPNLGMIPKENAGDARAARTAKFTYYVHRVKARDAFNDAERRALAYALTRARTQLYVTASGRPTRGISAPEFFEELRAARLPGTCL